MNIEEPGEGMKSKYDIKHFRRLLEAGYTCLRKIIRRIINTTINPAKSSKPNSTASFPAKPSQVPVIISNQFKGKREKIRRQKQIAKGMLRKENGLRSNG